jgi:hypothetical protein
MYDRIRKCHLALVNARQIALEVLNLQLKQAFSDAFNTKARRENNLLVDGRFSQEFFDGEIIIANMQNIARRLISHPCLFKCERKDNKKPTAFELRYITNDVVQQCMHRNRVERVEQKGISTIANELG